MLRSGHGVPHAGDSRPSLDVLRAFASAAAIAVLSALFFVQPAEADQPTIEEDWPFDIYFPPTNDGTNLYEGVTSSLGCALVRTTPTASEAEYAVGVTFPSLGMPSIGTARVAMLFVDFDDAPDLRPITEELVDDLAGLAVDYVDQVSGGVATLEVVPHMSWLRMSQNRLDYPIAFGTASRAAYTEYFHEAATLADPDFDFADIDALWVVRTPSRGAAGASVANGSLPLTFDGNDITYNVSLVATSDEVLLHEALHNYGLPDLYDPFGSRSTGTFANYVGPFDPMGWPLPPSELLGWQQWLLGWVSDDQVVCVDESTTQVPLVALGDRASVGTRIAVVRQSETEVVVVENRQAVGFDLQVDFRSELFDTGLLVYTVDGTITSGRGPIQVHGQSTNENYPDASVLLQHGERVAVGDTVVTAIQGPDGLMAQFTSACNGMVPTIDLRLNGGDGMGTSADDVILGTPGDDRIEGRGGNDVICAGDGNDYVIGGKGNDIMFGEGGSDRIFGSQGDDEIVGGDGDDRLHGNQGSDEIRGNEGADFLFGYADADRLYGGDGNDRMHGNFGDDVMYGEAGDDAMWGYGNDDLVVGGLGDDLIVGNFGNDTLIGHQGNDVLWGSDGDDTLRGEEGDDDLNGNSGDDSLGGGSGIDRFDGGIGFDSCFDAATGEAIVRCELMP